MLFDCDNLNKVAFLLILLTLGSQNSEKIILQSVFKSSIGVHRTPLIDIFLLEVTYRYNIVIKVYL